jgi:hypothetical protein
MQIRVDLHIVALELAVAELCSDMHRCVNADRNGGVAMRPILVRVLRRVRLERLAAVKHQANALPADLDVVGRRLGGMASATSSAFLVSPTTLLAVAYSRRSRSSDAAEAEEEDEEEALMCVGGS